jgi:hypothetical protein
MSSRTLLILGGGALALFLGFRSLTGYETTAEHLYAGEMVEITCDDGEPVGGEGLHLASADQACVEAREEQRGWAPWLLGAGALLVAWGLINLGNRRSR